MSQLAIYGYSLRASPPFGPYTKLYCLLTEAHVCERLDQGQLTQMYHSKTDLSPLTFYTQATEKWTEMLRKAQCNSAVTVHSKNYMCNCEL